LKASTTIYRKQAAARSMESNENPSGKPFSRTQLLADMPLQRAGDNSVFRQGIG